MRIVLTGATGFIGSHLVVRLQKCHDVVALVRRQRQPLEGVRCWVEQDLASPLSISQLPKRIDAVVHLAQSALYKQFPSGAEDMYRVNVESTFTLLEYARLAGARSFILASSGGVYGHRSEKFSEDDPVNPLTFYLRSKYAAELLVSSYKQFFTTVILRFFFVYGPGQTRMLVPTLIRRVREGQKIVVEGKPGIRINPIYIDDAVRVFEPALLLESADLFNVAGEEVVTLTDVVRLIERIAGRQAVLEYSERKAAADLIGDNSRMKERLDVYPEMSLELGIGKTVERIEHEQVALRT